MSEQRVRIEISDHVATVTLTRPEKHNALDLAMPDARLSVMEGKWGLIPDMSITQTLPRLVGIDVAKELTYTARVLSGEEAMRLGLVTHLAEDPLIDALELASQIAARSPDAIRGA